MRMGFTENTATPHGFLVLKYPHGWIFAVSSLVRKKGAFKWHFYNTWAERVAILQHTYPARGLRISPIHATV